jgi:hypothetical protein
MARNLRIPKNPRNSRNPRNPENPQEPLGIQKKMSYWM